MSDLDALPTPALLLDLDVLERNLAVMQARADRLGVKLRPHIKTHKCLEIAARQRALGCAGLTVSTLAEARAFADAGFDDLTWAVPNPLAHLAELFRLLQRGVTLRVLVDDLGALHALEAAADREGARLHVWIEVDSGDHRTGVDPHTRAAHDLVRAVRGARSLVLDGLLTHGGHGYHARSKDELRAIAREERDTLLELAARLRAEGLDPGRLSLGSTPTMSVADELGLAGIDEVRPGNYVFHDYTQATIGSCTLDDCALTVLASVISHPAGADRFVTDAGALALSKDPGPDHLPHRAGLGAILAPSAGRGVDPALRVERLSQEHGLVRADDARVIEGRFRVGERVQVLVHHACLTAAQFDEYHVVRGGQVVDRWRIRRER